MKRLLAVFALVLLSAAGSYAQNGMVQLPPVLVNSLGQPLAGINVAVCSSLTTSVAAVTNNIATLTVSSTTGFTAGMTLNVSGFTGGDTYFNVSSPIISLSATTLSYALTHANASASSNGSVYQTGNSSTSCAPLATLYTDNTTTTTTANPFTSTGLGNVIGWVAPGYYHIQSYGTGVTTTVQQVSTSCVPSATVGSCGVTLNGTNAWTGTETHAGLESFAGGISPNGTNTLTLPAATDTLTGKSTTDVLANKTIDTAAPNTLKVGGVDISTAWTAYTPTVTSASGSLTTTSASGRYKQQGKTIFVEIHLTVTTVGTGAFPQLTLPALAKSGTFYSLSGFDVTNRKALIGVIGNPDNNNCQLSYYDATNPAASGTSYEMTGVYEAN